MRGSTLLLLLLLVLCLLPAAALAEEWEDDGEDEAEVDDSIITEVEGTGNEVIVIGELVVNINAGDIIASRQGGEAMELVHRMIDMLHEGMGPGMAGHPPVPGMMPQPHMQHPGAPGISPEEFRKPFHPRMGPHTSIGPPGGRDWRGEKEPWRSDRHGWRGDGNPAVFDNPFGFGMMPPQGGMQMPGATTDDQGAEMRQLMMEVGRLAWGDPQFRAELRRLVHEYRQDAGEHERGHGERHHEGR